MEKHSALELLLETGLRHLYTAEKDTYENLKTLADKASSLELKDMFLSHRAETDTQIKRLEKIFRTLDIDPNASKLQGLSGMAEKSKELLKTMVDLNFTDSSKGMDGIIKEGNELLRHFGNTEAVDFALVGAGQKVECFEVASYKSLCLIANVVGHNEVADLLDETLSEELDMEDRLSEFAETSLADMEEFAEG